MQNKVEHKVKLKNICPKELSFDLEDGLVKNINFQGGCPGNLPGLAKLAEGRDALEVANLLSGIRCRKTGHSCPDELSRAIYKALGQKAPKRKKPVS